MPWQGLGWRCPGQYHLPEQADRQLMGDVGFPAHSPLPFQTQETSPVWRGKLLILSFPLGAPLFPTMDAQSTAAPEKILPGALDDALSYLVPFRAQQRWARPHSCLSSSMCLAATGTGRASSAGVLPAQGQQLALTEIQGIFQSKKETFSSC